MLALSHGEDQAALLAVRRRLQSRGDGRPSRRLLPRHRSRPSRAREWLGATYAIPIIYVPLLMITHIAAFYFLARPQPKARALAGDVAVSY